ncbi:MAG TPA: DUF3616 domain-containing protein [Blastocatellia bacterium]|nr:DUF3616 domain-containing protein [Blastocatellia bacterium]
MTGSNDVPSRGVKTQPEPGRQQATLRIQLQDGDVIEHELTQEETTVGKGLANDLALGDPTVSNTHAVIRLEDGAYTIRDLNSRNGTSVNGERVTETRRLRDGDVLKLGRSVLTFHLTRHRETALVNSSPTVELSHHETPLALTEDSLAQIVTAAGLVARPDLERLRGPEAGGRRLYRALIDEHLAGEEQLRDLMSTAFRIPTISLVATPPDEAAVVAFPPQLALRGAVFPVSVGADRWTVAVADPTDTAFIEDLRRELGREVELRLATRGEITGLLDQHYGPRLIGVLPSGEKFEYHLRELEVAIGKAPHNLIVLTEPTVSNTHAVVLTRQGSCSIIDLGSRNGTFVNGERVGNEARPLRHGDLIKLGQALLTFRNPAETGESRTGQLTAAVLDDVRRRAGEPAAPKPAANIPAQRPPLEVAPLAAASVAAGAAETEEEKGEKKKKKKKKEKDDRLKAAILNSMSRIVATILSAVLSVVIAVYVLRSGSGPGTSGGKSKVKFKPAKSNSPTPFQGGSFEASGVVQVGGTNAVLFVDNKRPGEVFWMQLDETGKQVGDVKPIPLGTEVKDPEGITYGGSFYYVVGSQSDSGAGEKNALVRFAIDSAGQRLAGQAEVIPNLSGFLLDKIPELKGDAQGGLNIEGIAWDPNHERLLLGLRSPLIDDQALLVPLKLADPRGPFAAGNLRLDEPRVIRLSLGGQGVRDIHYDSRLKSFLIISGAPEHKGKTDFSLWEWSGNADQQGDNAPREVETLDRGMKPEGVAHVKINGTDFIFIVGDASSHLKLDYSDKE